MRLLYIYDFLVDVAYRLSYVIKVGFHSEESTDALS
jgi:hypothetical protein